MMGHREELKSGMEYDALTTGGKRVHRFKPGVRPYVKRKFWKRQRAAWKSEMVTE